MSNYKTNIIKVLGPYTSKKDGRKRVCVYYKNSTKPHHVSYPKFLVEYALDRALDPNKETIDHIDNDINNNSWNNLRIVPRAKHAAEDVKTVELVIITCVLCGTKAEKRANHLNHNARNNKAGPFCNNSCAGKYSRAVQMGIREPLPPQPEIPIENRIYVERTKQGGTKVSDLVDVSVTEKDILEFIKTTQKKDKTT